MARPLLYYITDRSQFPGDELARRVLRVLARYPREMCGPEYPGTMIKTDGCYSLSGGSVVLVCGSIE